jgi:hypothetical protein
MQQRMCSREDSTLEFESLAYSSDREQSFHAMVNGAWRGQLEMMFLLQVFTMRQANVRVLS